MDHCMYKVLVQLFWTGCILSKILLGTTLKRELWRSLQWFLKQGRVLLCSQVIYAQCYGESSQLDARQQSFWLFSRLILGVITAVPSSLADFGLSVVTQATTPFWEELLGEARLWDFSSCPHPGCPHGYLELPLAVSLLLICRSQCYAPFPG